MNEFEFGIFIKHRPLGLHLFADSACSQKQIKGDFAPRHDLFYNGGCI